MVEKDKKTRFATGKMRKLRKKEGRRLQALNLLIFRKTRIAVVASIPAFVSSDGKPRDLIFSQMILDKVVRDHGEFIPENFVINANDWDAVLRNILDTHTGERRSDKINLLKRIPRTGNYLLIAANKDNGFFIVSHFETLDSDGTKLKSLLGRGELFSKSGKPLAPDTFLIAPSP